MGINAGLMRRSMPLVLQVRRRLMACLAKTCVCAGVCLSSCVVCERHARFARVTSSMCRARQSPAVSELAFGQEPGRRGPCPAWLVTCRSWATPSVYAARTT